MVNFSTAVYVYFYTLSFNSISNYSLIPHHGLLPLHLSNFLPPLTPTFAACPQWTQSCCKSNLLFGLLKMHSRLWLKGPTRQFMQFDIFCGWNACLTMQLLQPFFFYVVAVMVTNCADLQHWLMSFLTTPATICHPVSIIIYSALYLTLVLPFFSVHQLCTLCAQCTSM